MGDVKAGTCNDNEDVWNDYYECDHSIVGATHVT